MRIAIYLTIALIIVFCLIFLFYPEIKRIYYYNNHKKRVSKKLYTLAKNDDVFLINDIIIKQVDNLKFAHIYFGKKYIYCIQSYTFPYGIQGDAKDLKWFSYDKKKNFSYIENLLKENDRNINSLMRVVDTNDKSFFYSIIVLNDTCYIDIKNIEDNQAVINFKDLKRFILSKEKDKSVKAIQQESLQKTVDYLYKNSNKNL